MDHLAVANWMFMCVNSGEDDDQPDPPKPVPRPGVADEDEERGGSSTQEGAAEVVSPGALARFFG
ncbi:hypothetical protein [Streptomyces sp. NPDC056527]|uniref:hypothetical protein n=1 Tax=Streptomyces sp. NPDC056527 TaxID=3345853 RepID=UPI0036AD30EA